MFPYQRRHNENKCPQKLRPKSSKIKQLKKCLFVTFLTRIDGKKQNKMFTEREKVANVRGNRNFGKRSYTFPKNFPWHFLLPLSAFKFTRFWGLFPSYISADLTLFWLLR